VGRRESRRLVVFAILVAIACALWVAWLYRFGKRPTPEERAREKAEELKEKVREFTH
jgi:membrane protein implicated in regulation of membrane protease activity